MENVKLFIKTSLHLLFAKDARVGAGIFTVFNLVVYYVPYLHFFNYFTLGIIIQILLFKRIFWTRILEILALSAASVLIIASIAVLVFSMVKLGALPPANEINKSTSVTFMSSIADVLNLVFSIVAPMTVAFFCLMVSPTKFKFSNFLIQANVIVFSLFETLRSKKISRIPFMLISVCLLSVYKTDLCFTLAAPFIAAWLFLYVFDMRLDLKQEEKATNLKQAHSF